MPPGRNLISGALIAALAAIAHHAPARAFGAECTVKGSAGNDLLVGTASPDVICGFGGDDTLRGKQDGDVLRGGLGDDVLIGGQGPDRIFGGPGVDEVSFRWASEAISASVGLGRSRGQGDDRFAGVEIVTGSAWNDTIDGSGQADVLRGLRGADVLRGRGGDDLLSGGMGADHLEGGMGDDRLEGGPLNDLVLGGFGADDLLGGLGPDRLEGGSGRDTIQGEAGDDEFRGGEGNDGCVQWEGSGRKIGCERTSYAVAGVLLLWVPSANPVGFGYHESLFGTAVSLRPLGRLVENDNGRFDAPPRTDGPSYVVMASRGRAPGPTTATDIVLPSRSHVLSPVDGTVVAVEHYLLYCESPDWKVVIEPDTAPSSRVLVLHMATPYVSRGDAVLAGRTVLGVTGRNDGSGAQENAYFPDEYPHIHIEVEANGASPTPGCRL